MGDTTNTGITGSLKDGADVEITKTAAAQAVNYTATIVKKDLSVFTLSKQFNSDTL